MISNELQETAILSMEKNLNDVNPLIFVGKLILGIILSIISIVWLLHMY